MMADLTGEGDEVVFRNAEGRRVIFDPSASSPGKKSRREQKGPEQTYYNGEHEEIEYNKSAPGAPQKKQWNLRRALELSDSWGETVEWGLDPLEQDDGLEVMDRLK